MRKINPLRRKLSELDAWITGQRMDQSVTRSNLPSTQVDEVFQGAIGTLYKFNPLNAWRSADIWHYIRRTIHLSNLCIAEVCIHWLRARARPVAPHEHERAGRWWWELETQKNAVCTAKILSRGVR